MWTLSQLEQAIHDSWGADTADEDNDWTPDNPSCGQCDVTALVVHDLLGGDLLGADVFLDGERVEAHMWNRLPSGIDVDLTRDQFRRGAARAAAHRGDRRADAPALPPLREVPRPPGARPRAPRPARRMT